MKSLMFVMGLMLVAFTAPAQNETALLNAVKKKLERVNDYTATGQMKLDVSFIKAPPSVVMVYYKKPNRFKIKKSDGISILPKGGVNVNLNALLGGNDYTVIPAGTAAFKGVPVKVVKLLPLNDKEDIVLMTLYIDEKALLIRKNMVSTKENGSYEIELDYGKYAAWGLPDKVTFLFNTKDYKIPKGLTFEYEKGDAKKKDVPKDAKGKVEVFYSQYTINKGVDDKVFLN